MQIKTEHLLPALGVLMPIVGKRTTLPILNHVKLESDGETLTISATDLDQFAEQRVECNGKIEPCCVNANRFYLLAKSAVDKIGITQTAGVLKVTANGVANLKTLPAEEFPPLPKDKQVKQGCHCVDLADCVEPVVFAAANVDESRFVLQHINVSLEAKKMLAQATNARMIATVFKPAINGQAQFLCHAKFAGIFCQYLRSPNSILSLGESYFSVKSDSGTWLGKLPEEKWPQAAIDAQINAKKEKIGVVVVEEICGVVGLAGNLAKDSIFNAMNLSFTKKALNLTMADYSKEIGGSFSPLETRMGLKILSTAFQHLKSDEVTIYFGSSKIFMSDGSLDLVLATLTPN